MSTSGQPVTKAALERRFIESGEGDRMKELLLQRLRETGWVEEVENMCRNVIQTKVDLFNGLFYLRDFCSDYRCRGR